MILSKFKIGFLSGAVGSEVNGQIAMQQSNGRLIDELARVFAKCYISIAICPHNGSLDHVLKSSNISLIPLRYGKTVAEKIKHPLGILKTGKKLVDSSDIIFVRGTLPYLPIIHIYALLKGRRVVQWMAGDLLESLKWYPDAKKVSGRLRAILAWLDEKWFKFIRHSTKFYMVTSGCVLYEKYKSPRTTEVVSSTISKEEFSFRKDTCVNDFIRILFVGFVRQGKGLTYLIDALSLLKTSRQVQLAIVGDTEEYSEEKIKLKRQIQDLGLTEKVTWEGYTRFGEELFEQFRKSDILVLPTLTEGAPHVLVEARAHGLPVISTFVGGIPSSVKNGEDGVLVPPRDGIAIARAIDKIITEDNFRQKLISNGYMAAEAFSLESFISKLKNVFDIALNGKRSF